MINKNLESFLFGYLTMCSYQTLYLWWTTLWLINLSSDNRLQRLLICLIWNLIWTFLKSVGLYSCWTSSYSRSYSRLVSKLSWTWLNLHNNERKDIKTTRYVRDKCVKGHPITKNTIKMKETADGLTIDYIKTK